MKLQDELITAYLNGNGVNDHDPNPYDPSEDLAILGEIFDRVLTAGLGDRNRHLVLAWIAGNAVPSPGQKFFSTCQQPPEYTMDDVSDILGFVNDAIEARS